MPQPSRNATFHAIADPTRRQILMMLRDGERPATELARPFRATQPAISQHLGVLRRAGLVINRRQGRHRYYSVRGEALREVAAWVAAFDQFWDEKFSALGAYLERKP